jgi:hypothetical protein
MNAKDHPFACPHCTRDVQPDDDFCPACGEVFGEQLVCDFHPGVPAAGVCVVCARPFCGECGSRVDDRFLCDEHSMLEIYEGMVRVFGNSDAVQVQFAKAALEEAGFHPYIYSRKASPLSLGGPDYTLFRASGEYDGHLINEFKLMVPCQEMIPAREKLRELEFLP